MDLFDLPKTFYVSIISKWISTSALSMLDSAFCNKTKRLTHLEWCSEATIPGITEYTMAGKQYLEWVCRKRMNVNTMQLYLQNMDSELLNKELKYENVTTFLLLIHMYATEIEEQVLVDGIPSKFKMLTSFTVYRVPYIRDEWICALADNCPLLQKVELTRIEISDIAIKHLAEQCPLLKDVQVKYCNLGVWNGISVESVRDLVALCPDLHRVAYDMFEYCKITNTLKLNSTALDKEFETLVEIFPLIRELHLVLEKMTLKTLVKLRETLAPTLQVLEMRVCSKGMKDIEAHFVAIAELCRHLKSVSLNCDLSVASLLTMLGFLPRVEMIRTKSVLYDTVRRTLEIKAGSGTKISDQDVLHLVNYPFILSDVDGVALEDCAHVTDKALKHIATVFNSHLLHFTALQCGGITDDGVDEIFSACDRVVSINVSNCKRLTTTACLLLSQKCAQVETLNWSNYSHFFAGKQVVKSRLSPAVIGRIGDTWTALRSVTLIGDEYMSYGALAELVLKCKSLAAIETSHLDYQRNKHIHFSSCAALTVNSEVEVFVAACTGQSIGELKITDCAHLVDATLSLLMETFAGTVASVSVIGCPLLSDAILVAFVDKKCVNLRMINIFGTSSSTSSGAHIARVLRHCTALIEFQNDNVKYSRDEHSLTMKGSCMSNEELRGVMESIPLLELVAVQSNALLTDEVVAFVVGRFAGRLRNLQLKECLMLTEKCVRDVVTCSSILTRLDLLDCPLIGNGVVEILLEHIANLQELSSFSLSCVCRDRQYDDHLIRLVAGCPSLQYLYVTSDDNSLFTNMLAEKGVRHHPKLVTYA